MATVTDGVTSIHRINSEVWFGNHLYGVYTYSFTIDTSLLNQHTVFLVVAGNSFRNMCACSRCGTGNCIGRVSILEPIIEDTCCQLVADIGRQGHTRT